MVGKMSNELERYKTTCLAQEAEIARLQSALDNLKELTKDYENQCLGEDYSSGYETAMYVIYWEINRITGTEK